MTNNPADTQSRRTATEQCRHWQPVCTDRSRRIAPRGPAWPALALLTAACVLCVLKWRPTIPPALLEPLAELPVPVIATQRIVELAAAGAYRLVLAAAVGMLAWWALPVRGGGPAAQLLRLLTLFAIVAGALWLRYPSSLGAVAIVPGLLVGLWGYTLARALSRGFGAIAGWSAASCVAIGAVSAALVAALTDPQPAVAENHTPAQEDRQRWRNMLSAPRTENSDLVELQVSPTDLNLMAGSWLAAQSTDLAVAFQLDADAIQAELTCPVSVPALGTRHVNVAARMQPTVANGLLDPSLRTLRIGNLRVPAALTAHASAAVRTALNDDRDIGRVLSSIHALKVANGQMLVLCAPDRASQAAAESVAASPEASDELRSSVRFYMHRLVTDAKTLPAGEERFLGLIRTAFAIARERSTPETAAAENRAALIALGIQAGDPRVRRLAGFHPDERMWMFPYPFDRKVTLRGRNDLARHFFVSAALRSLSSREVSFAVGLIKEQLDAADGGSGFSFADLAADLAGVQFAQRATGENAAALQTRLAAAFESDGLMPSIDGLPEGLSQDAFKEQFGSLTDPRFLKMTVEIQQRMLSCELLNSAR